MNGDPAVRRVHRWLQGIFRPSGTLVFRIRRSPPGEGGYQQRRGEGANVAPGDVPRSRAEPSIPERATYVLAERCPNCGELTVRHTWGDFQDCFKAFERKKERDRRA